MVRRVELPILLALVTGLACHPRREQEPAAKVEAAPKPAAPVRAAKDEAEAEPEQPPAPPERALGVVDIGVFSDLDEQIQLALPDQAEADTALGLVDEAHRLLVLYLDARPVKVYPLLAEDGAGSRSLALGERVLQLRPGDHGELAPLLRRPEQLRILAPGATAPPGDRDGDGIPDPVDVLIGAHKTVANAADYDGRYVSLPAPGGDVPREIGVCTDVIVRALRNAGVDLQVEVHADIARAPRRYPMVKRANDDIDHRRVRTILPWFRAHWRELPIDPGADDPPLEPGDVLFMETIASRAGPDHIGVVGERPGENGELLVANNWTEGYQTQWMELVGYVEQTQRFRLPPTAEHAGPISGFRRQLLVVVSEDWGRFRGRAQRFARAEVGGDWAPVGEPFEVVLGHGGLGWGRGLHGEGAPVGQGGPAKREGDGRSPAGVFAIGRAFGRSAERELSLDYRESTAGLRCVDDPSSRFYARLVDAGIAGRDWSSAEPMRRYYELAIVIAHNPEAEAGAGSCIFLHGWRDADTPVTGCTAMANDDLERLAKWLEPDAVVVSLPRSTYAGLRERWDLPPL